MSEETQQITVLITTDTAEALKDINAMLAPAPEVVVVGSAASGEESIDLAHNHEPDIVVMDYDMPGLDGAEATRAILKNNPRAQVIMISLVNDADDIRHAMRAGARDYLVKPLGDTELLNTIQWLIRERREYARMSAFVKKLRKAYEALFTDDKPVPDTVVAFLEKQMEESPGDRLAMETLAVAYARNRSWEKLKPLITELVP